MIRVVHADTGGLSADLIEQQFREILVPRRAHPSLFWLRPAILRHDPGLAASPPVRYMLRVERSRCSPLPFIIRCGRTISSRSRTSAGPSSPNVCTTPTPAKSSFGIASRRATSVQAAGRAAGERTLLPMCACPYACASLDDGSADRLGCPQAVCRGVLAGGCAHDLVLFSRGAVPAIVLAEQLPRIHHEVVSVGCPDRGYTLCLRSNLLTRASVEK